MPGVTTASALASVVGGVFELVHGAAPDAEPDPDDQRSKRILLTPRGTAAIHTSTNSAPSSSNSTSRHDRHEAELRES